MGQVAAPPLLDRLVDELVAGGHLASPEWEAAFRRVPRHVFVARVTGCWPPDEEGRSSGLALGKEDGDRWLQLVYSDRLLIIAKDGDRLSSSSAPRMMARFLDFLRAGDGDSVLEVGTGSGYNAAILCERLGAENVTSIDVDPELVEDARARLAELGYRPALATADGFHGYPPGPYDRIVATCSVPRIPDAWLDQLRPGGWLVTPMSGGHFDQVDAGLDRFGFESRLPCHAHRPFASPSSTTSCGRPSAVTVA